MTDRGTRRREQALQLLYWQGHVAGPYHKPNWRVRLFWWLLGRRAK